jgi:hypothetical protein
MQILFVEQAGALPPAPAGRVAVVDVAFAGGEKFRTSTQPFLAQLGDRLAIWIDHHEHLVGWGLVRGDPRFLLVPNRDAHACPELVTPEVVARAGAVDVVVAHADVDGLLSAVKFLRRGLPPWPEADEDARAADSPGRGHAMTARGRLLADALSEAGHSLKTAAREELRQAIAAALIALPTASARQETAPEGFPAPFPAPLLAKLRGLQEELARTIAPARALADAAVEEARGVLVARSRKPLPRSLKKELLSLLEERAAIGLVVEGKAVTAATFRPDLDLSEVADLNAGRSDYRFAQATDEGRAIVAALGRLVGGRG